MIKTETLLEARTVEAGTLAKLDKLACSVAAKMVRRNESIGYRWDDGTVSYAPVGALEKLASTFSEDTSLTVAHCPGGYTFVQWSTGRMLLRGPDKPDENHNAYPIVIPLTEGLLLVETPGKITDKAQKLIEKLDLASRVKPPKQAVLQSKELILAQTKERLTREIERTASYARLDTTALERATALYSQRRTALCSIVDEMRWAVKGTRDGALHKALADFIPALPHRLMVEAENVARIPQAHKVKRMEAALAWHGNAMKWIDHCIGMKRAYSYHCFRHLSAEKIKEEYDRTVKRSEYSLEWRHLTGRLTGQQIALAAKERMAALTATLGKVDQELTLVRIKAMPKPRRSRSARLTVSVS